MSTATRGNETRVLNAFEALNRQDRDAFIACHAEDAVLHVGGRETRGIRDIADTEFAYFDAFPDLSITVEDVFAHEDTVAARWTITGTHQRVFKGIEPTGESVEFSAMGMFRFDGGNVSEVWLEADECRLLRQLGVIESLAT